MKRSCGILMHITSLPGEYSVGDFGSARKFIDFLAKCGFGYWQVLPFCMADDCNSPYKSYSAFSGNPYFISLDTLAQKGFLSAPELDVARQTTPYSCEYERLERERIPLLTLAAGRAYLNTDIRKRVSEFISGNKYISQFCEFMAKKSYNHGKAWFEWTDDGYDEDTLFVWQFIQYEFFDEWRSVREYANAHGVKLIGDIPIYVAHDSADVYFNREQFDLDSKGFPRAFAGCPPDYFSADGQFWGNPLYNWKYMRNDNFGWWHDRISHMLSMFDGVRIDHFRGLSSYWSIPAGAFSAKEGHWEKGPGKRFTDMLKSAAGDDGMIIAEDLGDITPDVIRLVKDSGFPGMRVFQFAFLCDKQTPHLPHNYINNCVAYTGTHDNNTLLGYIWESDGDERRRMLSYCGYNDAEWNKPEAYDAVIRTMYASSAGLVIFPIQDILHYGADTRMNIPGHPDGNWRVRFTWDQLYEINTGKYCGMAELYSREP